MEEESDEVVPDGVEEVELAKVELEKKEREQKLILGDIRKLSLQCDTNGDLYPEKEGDLWMISCTRSTLVSNKLCREFVAFFNIFFACAGLFVVLWIDKITVSRK